MMKNWLSYDDIYIFLKKKLFQIDLFPSPFYLLLYINNHI